MLIKHLVEVLGYSRRRVADLIKNSQVIVNDEMATSFSQVVSDKDAITVSGKTIRLNSHGGCVTLAMNKPKGILSATEDKREKTVLDILPPQYKNIGLFPAGRLDKDSTGLIILTNDGDLAYELTHPSFEHEKEYYVACSRPLTNIEKEKLENGVNIYESGLTSPAKVKKLHIGDLPYNYSVTIHEGKKRQIRRMFASISNPVQELKRVRISNLMLPEELAFGQFYVVDGSTLKLKQGRK